MLKRQPSSVRRSAGFTLIELLVVMAIIAVLMSLTTAAVIRVLGLGPQTSTRADISQLQGAIENFQTKYSVDYIPSRIVLREQIGAYDLSNKLELDSLTYLKRVFGRQLGEGVPGIDWNGNGQIDNYAQVLDGNECLVFFLGGIPQFANGVYACRGFSTNPRSPALATTGDRVGPFFQFKSNRLATTNAVGFLSYADPYGVKFAYFSSYGIPNGYNRYGSSDCASLGVSPYFSSAVSGGVTTYHNSKTFQIISAGKDKAFGPGGLWNPGGAVPGPVSDDMSNFYSGLLGG